MKNDEKVKSHNWVSIIVLLIVFAFLLWQLPIYLNAETFWQRTFMMAVFSFLFFALNQSILDFFGTQKVIL